MAKRVLFVEDDFLVGKMYKAALEKGGYEVDLVPNCTEAEKKLANQPKYDLILLDLLLPGKPGLSFLKEIKQENSPFKDIPVYILSNVDQSETIAEGVFQGAQGYFVKVDTVPDKMLAEINHFFESKKG